MMSRKRGRPEVRKPESTEDSLGYKVESPKPEEENNSAFGTPQSEINIAPSKSSPVGETFENNSDIEHPRSEIKNTSEIKHTSDIEHPTSEITEPQTANLKLPTENTMEVHHHPEVEKKGLKEYLLEGLMIFLAVTMGFFAETIRESISDNAKGKEYIRAFVQDLRTDTGNFSNLIRYDEKKVLVLNNLFPCFDTIEKDQRSAPCLVPIVKGSLISKGPIFTDGTMQQLKNAGGLRLLKEEDKDSIIVYDRVAKACQNFQSTAFQESQDNVRNTYSMLGNFKADLILSPDSAKCDVEIPALLSDDKTLINKFFNDLAFYKKATINQLRVVKDLKKRGTGLIKYFENKYNLE